MTHDYKSALDALDKVQCGVTALEWFEKYAGNNKSTVYHALQLAQEAEQQKSFKANIDEALAQEIMRTETVDGAICAFTIPRDELAEQLRKERDELARGIVGFNSQDSLNRVVTLAKGILGYVS